MLRDDKIDLKDLVRAMFAAQHERRIPMEAATATYNQPALTATKPVLTGSDRCDACGARAYYKAEFAWWADEYHYKVTTGDLLFCGHHATKYEQKLQETAISHLDERWNIEG